MATTISAIAALTWPALILVALLMFQRPLRRVIQTAEQRKWTLKVGGQELSMEEVSDQQNAMIADLQKQVGALSRLVADLASDPRAPGKEPAQRLPQPAGAAAAPSPAGAEQPAAAHAVLWVDDHPENNAFLIEQLQRNAVRVDLAKNTAQALSYLGQRRYGAILSDMGRTENGTEVPDAGMRLLKAVQDSGMEIPVLFYTSSFAERTYGKASVEAGAVMITSSPTVLSEYLQSFELL